KKLEDSEDEHQVYGRIVGIKRLHGVTTAQCKVTTVSRISTAELLLSSTKIMLLVHELQLLIKLQLLDG
ncbi:hypothetical protein Tco_1471898, partial [Tanacetum coccineum]